MMRWLLSKFFNDHCIWCRNVFCITGTTAIMVALSKMVSRAFAASEAFGIFVSLLILATSLLIGFIADRRRS